MQMRIGIDRRGGRNTLRLFRLPYVKYSTGANGTITQFSVRSGNPILRSPKGRSLTTGVTTTRKTERLVFSRVSAISRPAPLFCILFSGKTEKSMPAERQLRSRNKRGTPVNPEKASRILRMRSLHVLRARLAPAGAKKCPPFGGQNHSSVICL